MLTQLVRIPRHTAVLRYEVDATVNEEEDIIFFSGPSYRLREEVRLTKGRGYRPPKISRGAKDRWVCVIYAKQFAAW